MIQVDRAGRTHFRQVAPWGRDRKRATYLPAPEGWIGRGKSERNSSGGSSPKSRMIATDDRRC